MKKLCRICNKEFEPNHHANQECSEECKKIRKKKRLEKWFADRRVAKYKNCKICNNKFEIIGNNKTFCSSTCKKLSFSNKWKARVVEKIYKCLICKKEFETRNKNSKYCSKDCQKEGRKLTAKTTDKRRIKKNINRDSKKTFKTPLYQGVNYSANEDRAIDVLISNGFNTPTIGEILGRTARSIKNRKKEVDIQNFNSPINNNADKNLYLKEIINKLGKSQKGKEAISNHIIYNNLIREGFEVFKITREGAEFDIVALKDSKFFKIQTKTAGFREEENHFRMSSTTFFKIKLTSKGAVPVDYKYHNIDFFIFNCLGINTSYVIPSSKIKNIARTAQLSFYPHRSQHMYRRSFLNTEIYKERYDLIK